MAETMTNQATVANRGAMAERSLVALAQRWIVTLHMAALAAHVAVALLLLESRPTRDGRRWHYAFASLVSGPVTVKYGGKEVASIEKDYSRADRTKPYLELHGQPVPKE